METFQISMLVNLKVINRLEKKSLHFVSLKKSNSLNKFKINIKLSIIAET